MRRAPRRRQVLAFFAKLPPCLVGIEACATVHYWARELAKLGHDVRLIPPLTPRPMYAEPSVNRRIETDLLRAMGQGDLAGLIRPRSTEPIRAGRRRPRNRTDP
jgi:transposase